MLAVKNLLHSVVVNNVAGRVVVKLCNDRSCYGNYSFVNSAAKRAGRALCAFLKHGSNLGNNVLVYLVVVIHRNNLDRVCLDLAANRALNRLLSCLGAGSVLINGRNVSPSVVSANAILCIVDLKVYLSVKGNACGNLKGCVSRVGYGNYGDNELLAAVCIKVCNGNVSGRAVGRACLLHSEEEEVLFTVGVIGVNEFAVLYLCKVEVILLKPVARNHLVNLNSVDIKGGGNGVLDLAAHDLGILMYLPADSVPAVIVLDNHEAVKVVNVVTGRAVKKLCACAAVRLKSALVGTPLRVGLEVEPVGSVTVCA